jgi:hypothetical protein
MNTLKTGSRFHRNVAPPDKKASPPRRQQSAAGASKSHINAMAEPDVRKYRAVELSGGRLWSNGNGQGRRKTGIN